MLALLFLYLKNEGRCMMDYGYARVSSRDQNEQRQMIALRECGVEEVNVFIDKMSGKDFKREAWLRLKDKMKKGDVLYVKSIDRLGRNYTEILEEWRCFTREKGCDIVVLDMPLLDTRGSRDLTGTLISDIVLQLLSYVAETERVYIKQRQAEGIAAAKARGVKFGRPRMEKPDNFLTLKKQWTDGLVSSREAAREMDVSHRTFLNWVKE